MAKTLKDLFELYTGSTPAEAENYLSPQHTVQKVADRNGNGDDVFKASGVKVAKRFPDHGYDSPEDEVVHDAANSVPEENPNKKKTSPVDSNYVQKKVVATEAREITPALRAAQQNMKNVVAGDIPVTKKVSSRNPFSKASINTDIKHHKAEALEFARQHADHRKQHHNDLLTFSQDLENGNHRQYGIADHEVSGAQEEIESQLNKSFKRKTDLENMHSYHKGEYEALSGKVLKSNLQENNNIVEFKNRAVIETVLERYIPKAEAPISPEVTLQENLTHLTEKTQCMLAELYASLDEENREIMLDLSEDQEGINQLIDFSLSSKSLV